MQSYSQPERELQHKSHLNAEIMYSETRNAIFGLSGQKIQPQTPKKEQVFHTKTLEEIAYVLSVLNSTCCVNWGLVDVSRRRE
jgi:hypothetical protein